MPLVADPDLLSQSTAAASGTPDGEVFIDPAASTIELISSTDGYGASNIIAADGAALQAIYSFLKEQWKTAILQLLDQILFPAVYMWETMTTDLSMQKK